MLAVLHQKTVVILLVNKNSMKIISGFLVTAQKDRVLGDFGGVFTFGGNLMERKSTGVSNSVSALTVPDLFWLTNSTDSNRSISQTYTHRKTNSLYGTLGV